MSILSIISIILIFYYYDWKLFLILFIFTWANNINIKYVIESEILKYIKKYINDGE